MIDSDLNPTTDELITVTAARELVDKHIVFAGIGLPTLAVTLAQQSNSAQLEVIYESGVCGAHPSELPATIADSVLISGSEAVLSLPALFGYVLQGGHIDVGFLGAAQIDRHGNLNSSVIGAWDRPLKRLPGSGGAHEILANARETHVIMRRHSQRSFVRRLDFHTSSSPHNAREAGQTRSALGVTRVYTELGVLSRHDSDGELQLTHVHQGTHVDEVVAATGWDLRVSPDVQTIEPPSRTELELLRRDIDPKGLYLRS